VPVLVFLAYCSVAAGFPSPADDYATKAIDLNEALIRNPQATFLMRIRGTSMRDAGVDDGDVVLVDRALRPIHGSVIIAIVDGEFTCKRLHKRAGAIKLQAANPTFPDIVPTEGQTIELWGVVTKVIKSLAK
jgi:DNA polymerase V